MKDKLEKKDNMEERDEIREIIKKHIMKLIRAIGIGGIGEIKEGIEEIEEVNKLEKIYDKIVREIKKGRKGREIKNEIIELIKGEEEEEGDEIFKEVKRYYKNPHDRLFKNTWGKIENAKEFLEEYLPEEIKKEIEIGSIRIEKDTYITEELEEYYTDILYKVKIRGVEGYIFILIEHKSYEEEYLEIQILNYMLRIWTREVEEIKKGRRKRKLSYILPIVIYHGRRKFKEKKIRELIEIKGELRRDVIPWFKYLVYDIPRMSTEEIEKARDEIKIVMKIIKYINEENKGEKEKFKIRLKELIKEIQESSIKNKNELIKKIFIYTILSIKNIEYEEIREIIEENKGIIQEGGDIMGSFYKLIKHREYIAIKKGKIEGIKEGIKKGKIEGKIEGIKKAIKEVIEERYGKENMEKIINKYIEKIKEENKLEKILKYVIKLSIRIDTFEEFEERLSELIKEVEK